ncbi:MAG: helix-turn-helix transcriptional regulator [Gemmatimonadota bacterium]
MAKPSLSECFGLLVAERRRDAGMTQEALAAKAGVHRTYVGDIENGRKSPTLERARDIAVALDIALSELIQSAERGVRSSNALGFSHD